MRVGRAAGRISTAAVVLGLILGTALLALWADGVLDAAGGVALAAVVSASAWP